ncbi:MAG: hypothetical protein Q4C49_11070 [Bacillota bacterium]|nr:hypothetical protein [Bacillota bacterium]
MSEREIRKDLDIFLDENLSEGCQKKETAQSNFLDLPKKKKLDRLLENMHSSFSDKLLSYIRDSKFDEVEVYKRARMDRKLFSKIRSDANYHPRKKTVIRLILALELSIQQAKDLLNSAGYSFSNSNKFDLIIKFFIEQNMYDIALINEALIEYKENPLD